MRMSARCQQAATFEQAAPPRAASRPCKAAAATPNPSAGLGRPAPLPHESRPSECNIHAGTVSTAPPPDNRQVQAAAVAGVIEESCHISAKRCVYVQSQASASVQVLSDHLQQQLTNLAGLGTSIRPKPKPNQSRERNW